VVNADAVELNLRGFSNTKVAPEKIAIWEYSLRMVDPGQFSMAYLVIGTGFGHVTKQINLRELGAKLRKVASDHGANYISYEISDTEFRVRFLLLRDDIFQKNVKGSQ